MIPSDRTIIQDGFSPLFSAQLVEAWWLAFGSTPVSAEALLDDQHTGYLAIRAAVAEHYHRSRANRLRRVRMWLAYFSSKNPPTMDAARSSAAINATNNGTYCLEFTRLDMEMAS